MKNSNKKYIILLVVLAVFLLFFDLRGGLYLLFFIFGFQILANRQSISAIQNYLEEKEDNPLIQLNLSPRNLFKIEHIRELAGISEADFENLDESEKNKWRKFVSKINKKLNLQLTFFYEMEAIYITGKDEEGQWGEFRPLGKKNFVRNKTLYASKLGSFSDNEKENLHFYLERREVVINKLTQIDESLTRVPVLVGYIQKRADFEESETKVLFKFPEWLINYSLYEFKQLSSDDESAIKKVLLKGFKIEEDHYHADPHRDNFGEYTMWTRYNYRTDHFLFSKFSQS